MAKFTAQLIPLELWDNILSFIPVKEQHVLLSVSKDLRTAALPLIFQNLRMSFGSSPFSPSDDRMWQAKRTQKILLSLFSHGSEVARVVRRVIFDARRRSTVDVYDGNSPILRSLCAIHQTTLHL